MIFYDDYYMYNYYYKYYYNILFITAIIIIMVRRRAHSSSSVIIIRKKNKKKIINTSVGILFLPLAQEHTANRFHVHSFIIRIITFVHSFIHHLSFDECVCPRHIHHLASRLTATTTILVHGIMPYGTSSCSSEGRCVCLLRRGRFATFPTQVTSNGHTSSSSSSLLLSSLDPVVDICTYVLGGVADRTFETTTRILFINDK